MLFGEGGAGTYLFSVFFGRLLAQNEHCATETAKRKQLILIKKNLESIGQA